MKYKNVGDIGNYCTSCGACIPICPTKCISFDKNSEKVIVDNKKCLNCGLCLKACTGLGFDFKKNNKLFKDNRYNYFIGSYKKLFVGRSNNLDILKSSTSGGLATSVLLYCLKNKLIDGAITTIDDPEDPLNAKCIIAHNEEEILTRCKSRYHLIPLAEILKDISKEKRLAFVGLPCHIQAVRRLQKIGYKNSKVINLLIGLYCGQNQSYNATKFILRNLKIDPLKVEKISYRGPKWLGGFNLKTKKRLIRLSKEACDFINYMFIPKRCMVCYDFTSEFADISLGDAWSKKPSEYGWNEIIVRSNKGLKIIEGMLKKKEIYAEELDLNTLVKSHPGNFDFKKKGIFMRMKRMKIFPSYNIKKPEIKKKELVFQYLFFKFIGVMHSKPVRFLFSIIPLRVLGPLFYYLKRISLLMFFKRRSKNEK
ncbi:MAG: Coenzyme F420 hydrogenase/dehydrogenase, beta subunit C-terminal domain [Mariniphaga sp.]|nr:Coenzyme F420 hydrogenase/dehydrogenase, beta subunit C-terminal domain [Mariniphaga sp.]